MKADHAPIINKTRLDELYDVYNSRKWVHPDPLEFLYQYAAPRDREIVGIVASSLAYGRVDQIRKSVGSVLEKMGPYPYDFLKHSTPVSLQRTFKDFKHRFTTGKDLTGMLYGVKRVVDRYGSLYACFLLGFKDDEDTLPALSFLVGELTALFNDHNNSLIPVPERGSACKRLNLFLRWMVRKDDVDPGGWLEIPTRKLMVPLDIHMHRICSLLKLTHRKSADMRTVKEITRAFRRIEPEDPVRYDFALTRLGIRRDADPDALLRICA
jgi:uncharacterized protein (TIGR02757 family)